MAAGADLRHVSYFQMGTVEEPIPFRVPEHAVELGRRIAERNTSLVVIDPLIEFIDGSLDTHKSHAVRQAFASLNPLAHEFACAILAVIHLNKGRSTDAHLRHEASAAFTQVIRGGLLLGPDPDDPVGEAGAQRVLAVSSSNLGRIPPALVYRIDRAVVEGDEGEDIETAKLTFGFVVSGSPVGALGLETPHAGTPPLHVSPGCDSSLSSHVRCPQITSVSLSSVPPQRQTPPGPQRAHGIGRARLITVGSGLGA
jgi:hypothetical protein